MDQELILRIVLEDPPAGVDYALQKGSGNNYETVQKQKSIAQDLYFEFTARVKTNDDLLPNFLGPFVQGPSGSRFVYIDIGTYAGQKDSVWSRRLKIPLQGITLEMINQSIKLNTVLEIHVAGRGKDAGPNCGTVKPFNGWHLKGSGIDI